LFKKTFGKLPETAGIAFHENSNSLFLVSNVGALRFELTLDSDNGSHKLSDIDHKKAERILISKQQIYRDLQLNKSIDH